MKKRLFGLTAVAVALFVGASSAHADDAKDAGQADKSGYTLFNPTPAALMRDLSPDRPDTTESAHTVDAGHVQVELSFTEWAKGDGAEELGLLPFSFKIGLTNYADIQFVVSPYNRVRVPGRTDEGHADTAVRLKVNLWGNDEGSTALAIMPFITFPTGADQFTADAAEGGIVVPFLMALPAGFDLSMMAEFDFLRDGAGGRDTFLIHTASIGHDLFGNLGGYIEYAGIVDLDGDGKYQAYLDVGLTYAVGENVQFDCGAKIGLNAAAKDLAIFAGVTWRI